MKMKKIVGTMLALAMVLGSTAVSHGEEPIEGEKAAEVAEASETSSEKNVGMEAESLTLHVEIVKDGYVDENVCFGVFSEGERLSEKTVAVKNTDTSFKAVFEVSKYPAGKLFDVEITADGAEAEYNGARGNKITVQPYIYENENGEGAMQTVFYITLYIKGHEKTHTVFYLNNSIPYPYYLCGDEIYMDERLLSDLKIDRVNDGESLTLFAENSAGKASMRFFKDNVYALDNWVGYNLEHPAFTVDGIFYFPLSDVARVFGCEYTVDDSEEKRDITITQSVYGSNPLEDVVNAGGYESKTDYLIWVSKKDFSVRLFKGMKNHWTLSDSFTCTIGTDYTPTIEGEFEYIERLNRWTYATYYCGPVMRFHNGYALHSTLIKYDGTFYDNRVGMKLSHGCVRLHPEDINYLVEVVPFYTKILITA